MPYTSAQFICEVISIFFTMQLGDQFESIEAVREVVKAFVLDQGESFLTLAS